jgi:hypothetical protein
MAKRIGLGRKPGTKVAGQTCGKARRQAEGTAACQGSCCRDDASVLIISQAAAVQDLRRR